MCDPASLLVGSTAINVAQSLAGYANARAQSKASNQAADAAEQRLYRETAINYGALEARKVEEAFANGQVVQQLERDAALAEGQSEAAAAASHLSGPALNNLLLDIDRQRTSEVQGRYRYQDAVEQQIEREKEGQFLNTEAGLSQITASRRPSPSPLSLVLGIGGDVAQGQLNAELIAPPGVSPGFLGLGF